MPITALLLASGREKAPSTTFSPVTTFPPQTVFQGRKVPTRHLSRPRGGTHQAFSPLEEKIQNRVRPYPDIYICKLVGYQSTCLFELYLLVPKSWSRDQRARMGMHSRVWDPPVSGNRTQLCVFLTSMHAQKISTPLKNSLRGTPQKVSTKGSKIATLTSCSGRAFSAHMSIFGAMIDR